MKTHRWRLGPLLEAIFLDFGQNMSKIIMGRSPIVSSISTLLCLLSLSCTISFLIPQTTFIKARISPTSPTSTTSPTLWAGGWGKKSKDYSEAELLGKDSSIPSRPVEDYTLQQPRDFNKRVREDKEKVREAG